MNTMTKTFAALLTSAALLAPSVAFASNNNTDIEQIPDLFSLFQSDDDSTETAENVDTQKKSSTEDAKGDERDNGEPETK